MIRAAGLALLLAAAWPPNPAAAQAQPDSCRALLDGLAATAATVRPHGAGGCEYGDVSAQIGPRERLLVAHAEIERLTLAGQDDPRRRPPSSLRLVLHGARMMPQIDNKVAAYIVAMSVRPFDAVIDYDATGPGDEVVVNELSIDTGPGGSARASVRLVGFDRPLLQQPLRPERVGVIAAHLRVDNHGLFESFVLAPLAGALLQSADDPAAEVETLKRQTEASLRAVLGTAGTDPASIDALVRLVQSLPHPDKVLDMSLSLPKPFGVAQLEAVQTGAKPLAAFLPPGALHASYGR